VTRHFSVLSANAAVGALTGGVLQAISGGSFTDGFVRGALGGSLVYAGKFLAAQRLWGAGFAGREIAAVGTSVVRNASQGRPSFERLWLPAGPLPAWLAFDLGGRFSIRPQLDLAAAAWLGSNLSDARLGFDLGHSISAGAPVFTARLRAVESGDEVAQGVMISRSIVLSDPLTGLPRDPDRTFAHERIHVLQSDFALGAWSAALTGAVLPRLPAGPLIHRWITLDLFQLIPHWPGSRENDPWELEAEFFTRS
jgi:hypothetical protein